MDFRLPVGVSAMDEAAVVVVFVAISLEGRLEERR